MSEDREQFIEDLKEELFVLKNDYAVMKHRKDKEIQELKDLLSWTVNPWRDEVLERLHLNHWVHIDYSADPREAVNKLCYCESVLGAHFEREKTLPRRIRRLWHYVYSWICNVGNKIPPF